MESCAGRLSQDSNRHRLWSSAQLSILDESEDSCQHDFRADNRDKGRSERRALSDKQREQDRKYNHTHFGVALLCNCALEKQ